MAVAYLENPDAEQRRAVEGDRHVYASRTRFIPVAVMRHFECVTSPLAVRIDIGAKMPRHVAVIDPCATSTH